MKIVIVSDTHGQHEDLGQLQGDVLVHCGDMCDGFRRNSYDLDSIDDWFGRQRFDVILCIGGNHDFDLDTRQNYRRGFYFKHAIYLEDKLFEYKGVRFYGTPWVLDLPGWAFYLNPATLRRKWQMIPLGLDVLITHVPPKYILDTSRSGNIHYGCSALAERVKEVRPRIHCFGHNHASYGTRQIDGITYVNASNVTYTGGAFRMQNSPVEIEV